eukprot:m.349238 g.349238  ORF g.349238 m.349238 type:complete len:96 (-) comp40962_c0_seq1:31-318(-)
MVELAETARENEDLPPLDLRIHCTRAKEGSLDASLIAGRPNFKSLLDGSQEKHPGASTLIFACGPGRMVNQLWDESTKRNKKNQRVEFHHETFEF